MDNQRIHPHRSLAVGASGATAVECHSAEVLGPTFTASAVAGAIAGVVR